MNNSNERHNLSLSPLVEKMLPNCIFQQNGLILWRFLTDICENSTSQSKQASIMSYSKIKELQLPALPEQKNKNNGKNISNDND